MEEVYFNNIKNELIKNLKLSQSEIRIAVAWFTDQDLFDTLLCCLKRSVKISLLIVDDYINNGDYGLDFHSFIKEGGHLIYSKNNQPIHHKFCIIDNSILFTGSYNWTYFAENRNLENVIKIGSNVIINKYIEEFDRLKGLLGTVSSANKISLENVNYSSLIDYIGFDLLYKGKNTSNRKYIEDAKKVLPDNDEIKEEVASFRPFTIDKCILPFTKEKMRIVSVFKQSHDVNKDIDPNGKDYHLVLDLEELHNDGTDDASLGRARIFYNNPDEQLLFRKIEKVIAESGNDELIKKFDEKISKANARNYAGVDLPVDMKARAYIVYQKLPDQWIGVAQGKGGVEREFDRVRLCVLGTQEYFDDHGNFYECTGRSPKSIVERMIEDKIITVKANR